MRALMWLFIPLFMAFSGHAGPVKAQVRAQVLHAMDSLVISMIAEGDTEGLPAILHERGIYLGQSGDLAGMIDNTKTSFEVAGSHPSSANRHYIMSTASDLVRYFMDLHLEEEAGELIDQMISFSKAHGDTEDLGDSYCSMGDLHMSAGNYPAAADAYRLSINTYGEKCKSRAVVPWCKLLHVYASTADARIKKCYSDFTDTYSDSESLNGARVCMLEYYVNTGELNAAARLDEEIGKEHGDSFSPDVNDIYEVTMSVFWSARGDCQRARESCLSISDTAVRLKALRAVEQSFGHFREAALAGSQYLAYTDSLDCEVQAVIGEYFHQTDVLQRENDSLSSSTLDMEEDAVRLESERRLLQSREEMLRLQSEAASFQDDHDRLSMDRLNKQSMLNNSRLRQQEQEKLQEENRDSLQRTTVTAMVMCALLLLVVVSVISRYLIYQASRKEKKALEASLEASRERRQSIEESRENTRLATIAIENSRKMKSAVLANMSHDIRTPLNAIIGFNDLLADESMEFSDEDRESMLSMMLENADLLLSLLSDIVDKSALERGFSQIDIKATHLDRVCTSSIRMVKPYVSEGVALVLKHEGDPVTIKSDPTNLQRVVINLLTNACKYTKQGSITVSYGLCGDDEVELSVADTGPGISPEKAKEIFERFHSIDKTRLPESYGLGLSISLLIVEALHGRIYLDTEYTSGARFVIRLPLDCGGGVKAKAPGRSRNHPTGGIGVFF